MNYYRPEPTVVPFSGFNAADDGATLRGAMKGLGTDEQTIIDILTKRTNSQRQQIMKFYNEEYGSDLIEDLKGELGGKFEDIIVGLMSPPVEYLCRQLNNAMEGSGTDEMALIEILCTRNNKEVKEISETYEKLFDRPLAEHVCSESGGDFRRFLTLIVTITDIYVQDLTLFDEFAYNCLSKLECMTTIIGHYLQKKDCQYNFFIDCNSNVYEGRGWMCPYKSGQLWVGIIPVDHNTKRNTQDMDRILKHFTTEIASYGEDCGFFGEIKYNYVNTS